LVDRVLPASLLKVVRFPLHVSAILVGAAGLSILYHLSALDGLLTDSEAIERLELAHAESFLPKVGALESKRRIESSEILVIDARWHQDFVSAHLPGAINIEPNSTQQQVQEILTDIDRDQEFLIYCQSSSCPYAGNISQLMISSGYENILYFKGGWIDWKEHVLGIP